MSPLRRLDSGTGSRRRVAGAGVPDVNRSWGGGSNNLAGKGSTGVGDPRIHGGHSGRMPAQCGGRLESMVGTVACRSGRPRRKDSQGESLQSHRHGIFRGVGPYWRERDEFSSSSRRPVINCFMWSSRPLWISSGRSGPWSPAANWLRQQGIDVIFVPVPKMTEVYPEYFTDHCPTDRIIARHIRQALLELLEADVEVVDLLHALQDERDKDPEPLYQPADPHSAPRAQAIAVRLVAARLKRYAFVATAQKSRTICKMAPAPYPPASTGRGLPGAQSRSTATSRGHSTAVPSRRDRLYSSPIRRLAARRLHRRQLQRRVHGTARTGSSTYR